MALALLAGGDPFHRSSAPADAGGPPCDGPGGGPTLPPDPGGSATPQADAYGTQPILSTAYLGVADDNVIDFDLIPARPNEAVVVEQSGEVYRVALNGSFSPQLWGNLSGLVSFGGEQGLLALGFDPDFEQSCRVYAYYTPGCGMPCQPTILSRFNATPTDLNEGSEEILLSIEEAYNNHNGGNIAFDSSEYLYLSLGDGGLFNDPLEAAQRLNTLLGKVIRLDVSGPSGYAIPAGNPFNDGAGPIREEIFAHGFRNPWRMTIDPVTDDVWLGDVGQGSWEEVDEVTVGGNYGWDCYEGNHSFETAGCSTDPADFEFPRAEYSHSFGQAVTGGVVYRGDDMPELYGWYVYADFYSGRIWGVDTQTSNPPVQLADVAFNIASFTLLADGEIAIVTYSDGVHRLIADRDSDSVADAADNCPDWPNPNQSFPPWSVPAGDPDCDGFATTREATIGTIATDACGYTPGGDTASETWPADLVESNFINISDVLAFKPVFGQAVPPASARLNLVTDAVINVSDVLSLKPFFTASCTP